MLFSICKAADIKRLQLDLYDPVTVMENMLPRLPPSRGGGQHDPRVCYGGLQPQDPPGV